MASCRSCLPLIKALLCAIFDILQLRFLLRCQVTISNWCKPLKNWFIWIIRCRQYEADFNTEWKKNSPTRVLAFDRRLIYKNIPLFEVHLSSRNTYHNMMVLLMDTREGCVKLYLCIFMCSAVISGPIWGACFHSTQ